MFPWVSFLTYTVITAATPGPNTLMSMSNAGRKGFRRALPFNFGIWAGFSVVMILCAVFCGTLSALIPRIRLPMTIAGALYMLYLAWNIFRRGSSMEAQGNQSGFLGGLALQFVNPKIYLYGILSMEVYILPYYQNQPLTLLGFALLLALIGFIFTLCWAAFGSVFRRVFSHHGRIVNTIMALLLVYCAISLFLT